MSAVVVTDIRDMQLFLDGSHLLSPPPSPSIYSHFLFHVDFLSPGYLTFVQTLITLTTNYKTALICLLFLHQVFGTQMASLQGFRVLF